MGGCEGLVPAPPCFSSIAQLKGEVNVQLMKQFPFGWLIFQNHFCLQSSFLPPAASVGLTVGLGAPSNVSLPWDLRRALSVTLQGTNTFPSQAVGGAGPEGRALGGSGSVSAGLSGSETRVVINHQPRMAGA